MIQVERRNRQSSVLELARSTPTTEEVRELRQAFDCLLLEKGQIVNPLKEHLRRIKGFIFGRKQVGLLKEVEIEDRSLSVLVFRKHSQHPDKETLFVDIGMCSNLGERVSLALSPERGAYWTYLHRSFIGRGIGVESPTRNDIAIHQQVIDLIRNSQD